MTVPVYQIKKKAQKSLEFPQPYEQSDPALAYTLCHGCDLEVEVKSWGVRISTLIRPTPLTKSWRDICDLWESKCRLVIVTYYRHQKLKNNRLKWYSDSGLIMHSPKQRTCMEAGEGKPKRFHGHSYGVSFKPPITSQRSVSSHGEYSVVTAVDINMCVHNWWRSRSVIMKWLCH